MKLLLLLALVLAGCDLYVHSAAKTDASVVTFDVPPGPCPASPEGTCNYDQQVCAYPASGTTRARSCLCTDLGWTCDDCPADAYSGGSCELGDSCINQKWYDQYQCACDSQGTWECHPLSWLPDAGVPADGHP